MGSKEKDSYSAHRSSFKPTLTSNPHEKDSYYIKIISSLKSKIVGSITSIYASQI